MRFIVNLPPEELESVERICFQVEEAQWFYEDFIRPLDPSLPSLPLRAFSLRIFQHCPLFSQWSAEHYTTAFAEFMAYKSRVPVRGAILLNDAMDECVLVKGWKKGANWSFPRGKINKDENDLDCAVREVYEETGFDLQAAGLVREEREMKYIEQTMREQHMKLFVFRGVPKGTHFEPRTRKEISKIEWYKLTDLPTLKKHKQQDSNGGEHAGMSANKFYMVAPFLSHLKKWIAQEKKKVNRYSSNLAGPPILAEESEVENIQVPLEAQHQHVIPSDLPEVTISKSAEATAHLKELFNIGGAQPSQTNPHQRLPAHMPQIDAAKSTALLALLRGDQPSAELRAGPHTPLDQVSFPANMAQSPHHSHIRSPPSTHLPPPPQFHAQPELPTYPAPVEQDRRPLARTPQQLPFREAAQTARPPHALGTALPTATSRAPYQQTGDPDFARPRLSSQAAPRVPPASALPKLTSHTKSLLDVFQSPSQAVRASSIKLEQPSSSKQSLLDLFKEPTPASVSPPSSLGPENATIPATAAIAPRPQNAHQNSLLDLLSPPPPKTTAVPAMDQGKVVELSATPDHQHRPKDGRKDDVLSALFRQQNAEKAQKAQAPVVKEGETAATISGPLNQPNFEAVARSHKESADGMGRSPLTTHRTLFDPNHPTPVKIMARPQTPKDMPGKSPGAAKVKMSTASPKRSGKPAVKEQVRPPFQPQILKRPQTTEGPASAGQSPARVPAPVAVSSMSRDVSREQDKAAVERKSSQVDAHKQSLLSLFGGTASPASQGVQTPSRVVSPLSTSQLISPTDEVPVSAIEPISTRSRMGSLASMGGSVAPPRPGVEKRQTAAENKAFLLGYLGRMATQEG